MDEQKLALLRAAVAAKAAYWDALSAIEHHYVGEGDVSDTASDKLELYVSGLASDMDASTAWIGATHVAHLDTVMAE